MRGLGSRSSRKAHEDEQRPRDEDNRAHLYRVWGVVQSQCIHLSVRALDFRRAGVYTNAERFLKARALVLRLRPEPRLVIQEQCRIIIL